MDTNELLQDARQSVGVVWFSKQALLFLMKKASLLASIVALLLLILIRSLTRLDEWSLFHMTFLNEAAKFFGALLMMYVLIKILSRESHFDVITFLYGVSLSCLLGLILAWLLTGLSFLVLDSIGIPFITKALLVARQYYLFLLFGFASETLSGLKGWKAMVVGLGGITVLYSLSSLLGA